MQRSLHRISQSLGLALFALTAWVFFSLAGPIEAAVAVPVYAFFLVLIALAFALSFFALRLGTGGSATYWQSDGSRREVGRIILMIATAVGLLIFLGAAVDLLFTRETRSSLVLSLLIWTLVPAAFLRFRILHWPKRLRTAPLRTQITFALTAILLVSGVAFNSYSKPDEYTPWFGVLPFRIAAVFVAAAAEEVVFRVLLLTALLGSTGSRFQAVFLSGVIFAACHAPLAVAQPLLWGDWPLLAYALNAYAPVFWLQTIMGLLSGVVWLRTGSIAVVVAVHAVPNLGSALASGA